MLYVVDVAGLARCQNLGTALRSYSSAAADDYDYVIVGAGSAGCVLANRLSADPNNRVLLVEAGRRDISWKFHMPAALMYTLADPKYNWCYNTTPQKHVNNRTMYWPRAKVWGGCSSHNAMVFIRGHAQDFDRWEAEGAKGWSYADCLPYFKKMESYEGGADEYRGNDGPLKVSRGKLSNNPLFQAFVDAGVQAGYPATNDVNGYQQEGFGVFDMTIWNGRRSSHSVCYLRPILSRSNFKTLTRVLVKKVKMEGNKAVGIEYEHKGTAKIARAHKEVILSAGAINSPQLLMLSGIGNADELKSHDIDVVQHLPGVGENLQDHLELYVQHKCKKPITLYKYQWKFPVTMLKTGIEWFIRQTGPAASTHMDAGGFIRSTDKVPHPDIQYHFLPSLVINHGQDLGPYHAYQAHAGPLRPTSVGKVSLKNKDPKEYPLMDPNYLATEEDKQDFRHCVRHTREIFQQKAFEEFDDGVIQPLMDVQTDAQIDAFVREVSDSAYHPSCSAKMGAESDKMAVVDPACKVYGIENLRVVDASIMPSIASGNLNAPVTMMAEKAADMILGKQPLPKLSVPVYKHN